MYGIRTQIQLEVLFALTAVHNFHGRDPEAESSSNGLDNQESEEAEVQSDDVNVTMTIRRDSNIARIMWDHQRSLSRH